MKKQQINLKLFLDALGISSDVSTTEDIKRVHNAVYTGKMNGVDLGYVFGHYPIGMYSPELQESCCVLNYDLIMGDEEYNEYKLSEQVAGVLSDEILPSF